MTEYSDQPETSATPDTAYFDTASHTRNSIARALVRAWPWRNYHAIGNSYDVTNMALRSAIDARELMSVVKEDAVAAVRAKADTAWFVDAFPWDPVSVFVDDTSGFTRDIVRVGVSVRRYKPCWPWSVGATWQWRRT